MITSKKPQPEFPKGPWYNKISLPHPLHHSLNFFYFHILWHKIFFSLCHLQEWYGLLSSCFAAILLLSSSTLIAIVLIIQSELEIETSSIYASTTKLANDNGSFGSVGNLNNGATCRGDKMKKMSIKTSTTTTTPSSENSDVISDHHNHSISGDMNQQHHKQPHRTTTMKFSNLSSTNRGVKSAIGLSWLLPLLCAMCIPMIHKIMGHRSNEWWLEVASSDFIIFAITEILLVSLFVLLFMTLLKHLIYLTKRYEKNNARLKKRWVFGSHDFFLFIYERDAVAITGDYSEFGINFLRQVFVMTIFTGKIQQLPQQNLKKNSLNSKNLTSKICFFVFLSIYFHAQTKQTNKRADEFDNNEN